MKTVIDIMIISLMVIAIVLQMKDEDLRKALSCIWLALILSGIRYLL